jgi:hypothetical protein
MSARGVIVLFAQVGGLVKRVRFYVTPGLAVPVILGCGYINLCVKTIHPRERRVELTEGGSVAISNGPDACGAAAVSVRQPTPSTKVRLARRTTVTSRCYGALAMCMVGCAGPPTPSKIRIYHTLVAAPAFLAIFTIGPSATVLR